MTDEVDAFAADAFAADVFAVAGVDELFDGDLADFVARRDALVKRLRSNGDKDVAIAVKALRKPSTVAAAVNRVARQDGDNIEALLAAGQAVRAAQARAVRGDDDGALRTTARDWRALIQRLATAVARLVGDQYRDAAAATFEAASTDHELGAALRAGRLSTAAEPTGFGLAGMPDPPDRPPRERQHLGPRRVVDESVADGPVADEFVGEVAPVAPKRDEREQARIAAARARLQEREVALEKATHRLRRAEQRLAVARQAVEAASAARDVALAARAHAAEALAN